MERMLFRKGWFTLAGALLVAAACEELDDNVEEHRQADTTPPLSEVAEILSKVPLGAEQLREVAEAVSASAGNGYDQEYTMRNLFAAPGAGVGDGAGTRGDAGAEERTYERPLRELLAEAVEAHFATRSAAGGTEAYLDALSASDIQIYWPYAEDWDGTTLPVITCDPLDGGDRNIGYTPDGGQTFVDEAYARENPVWVVNRNEDASFTTLEMLRRENPDWGEGGVISVRGASEMQTLILRSFRAMRQFDSWFAGGSEVFVKCGAVEDFTASTEAELKLYNPTVTDFLIVVRRSQVGEDIPFNVVLVSEWSQQLDQCAFMVVEDDGGTQTSWKCSATVKYNSKSYGIDISIPLNTRDDIIWRGQLSRRYIEKYSGQPAHFGDVDLVLELV